MKVSINNKFTNTGTISVTSDDSGSGAEANMVDPSFSTKYTSTGSDAIFNIRKTFYAAPFKLGYLAIFGHNIGTNGADIDVNLLYGSGSPYQAATLSCTVPAGPNHVIFISTTTPISLVVQVDIEITKNVTADQITITGIAAGEYFDIPNGGEQAGYNRLWLSRNKKQRVAANDAGGPVGILTKTVSKRGSLMVQNASKSLFEGSTWNKFLDHAYDDGYFFVKENDGGPVTSDSYPVVADKVVSSYMCFDPDITVKAHPQTRQLHSFDVKFSAYTGT